MKPTIATKHSAGADLVSAEPAILSPGGKPIAVGTGYMYDLDKPALVKGRSGLAFKHHVWAFEGLIDADYRGEVKVLLVNLGASIVTIPKGSRIAQLVVLDTVATQEHFETEDAERGGGFGSTGN